MPACQHGAVRLDGQLQVEQCPGGHGSLRGGGNGDEPGGQPVASIGAIAGRVTKAGVYLLRVHYTPYWRPEPGSLCVEPAAGGMTRLVVMRRGRFALRAVENPIRLFETLLDSDRKRCAPHRAGSDLR